MTATQEWQAGLATSALDELDFSGLDHVATAAYVVTPDYRIHWANDAAVAQARQMTGDGSITRGWLAGRSIADVYLHEVHGAELTRDGRLLPLVDAHEVDGSWRELHFAPVRDPRTRRYLGATMLVMDITEQKRVELAAVERETDAHALSTLVERLAEAQTLGEVTSATLNAMRTSFGFEYAAAYKIDEADAEAYLVDQGGEGGRYADGAADFRPRRGDGVVGRTWARGGMYLVHDLGSATDDPRLAAAAREGFVAAFGMPAGTGDRVTGIFEFLSRVPLVETKQRSEAISAMSRVCNQALARVYAAAAERDAAARTRQRVADLLEVAKAAEAGDLTRAVAVDEDDVVGQMAGALGGLMAAMRESLVEIDATASTLASASDLITGLATELVGGAGFAADKAASASGATVEVSASIQSVATATEQMSASIHEIARNASDATSVATEAVAVAGEARDTITELVEASSAIGQVVKLITSIATQTNLLALNATIEAARAGDAGRGFAVVAHEVKELAGQTAKATEDIGNRIATIQARTTQATGAIGQVTEIIGRINDIQTTIASAVEEQTATTNEIARSVTEVAAGANAIAEDVDQVAGGTELGRKGTLQTADAAKELEAVAARMRELVGRFVL